MYAASSIVTVDRDAIKPTAGPANHSADRDRVHGPARA